MSAAPQTRGPQTGGSTAREPAPWFDPGWLIRRTLEAEAGEIEGAAEDALVAWLVRLPPEQDPAEAAGQLLQSYRPARPAADPLARRLFELLEETHGYTRGRLARVQRRRRRLRRDA